MKRALGAFAVVMALLSTATAQETEPAADKPAEKKAAKKPAKKAESKKKVEPPVEEAPVEEEADRPLTPEELEAAMPPHIKGPKLVDLGQNIEIDVPEGMILLEKAQAQKWLREGGDDAQYVLAIVGKLDADWIVVVEFADVGYVEDKDADQLDANELFRQFEEGTRQQNIKRKAMGVPELFLDGWSEMPTYQKVSNKLVWGLKGHSTEGPVINFFTRFLGRHGYLSLNLIDTPDKIEQSKLDSAAVLTAIRFRPGATYADYREGDKHSGLGLRALVLGGTGVAVMKAAKAGFLVKFLLIFKKGFIFIILGLVGLGKWLLGRKKQNDYVPPQDPPNDPPQNV